LALTKLLVIVWMEANYLACPRWLLLCSRILRPQLAKSWAPESCAKILASLCVGGATLGENQTGPIGR
jgi:hypothetical protein